MRIFTEGFRGELEPVKALVAIAKVLVLTAFVFFLWEIIPILGHRASFWQTIVGDGWLISGVVTYEDGKPTKGATVYAVPLGRPMGTIIPQADTDEAGHYAIRIPGSWFGELAIAAKKEDEDYPDMSNQFYSDGKFQTVTLSISQREATVTIRLGPKAGVLHGIVVDARTNAPLSPCVEFRRTAEPNNFMRASGLVKPTYKLLIPADTDVLMQILLDGYRPWYFPGTIDKETQQPVRLASGESRAVDIKLVPDETAKTGCPKPLSVPDKFE